MNTTLQSLKNLYVKLGGTLADTYEDIASGIPVSDYTAIPDATDALGKLEIGGGGLTLYGPYSAHPSEDKTLQAGSIGNVVLDVYTDNNGNNVSFPSGDYDYNVVLLNAIYAGYLNKKSFSICGVAAPSIFDAGILSLMNNTSSSVTLSKDSMGVDFYTSFPMDVSD